jgi:hypothetical protein
VVRFQAISFDQSSLVIAVQWSGASWLVRASVRALLRFSPRELLLLEAGR